MPLQLRPGFDPAEIPALAARFGDLASDAAFEREVVAPARAQRFLTKGQFLRLCEWKSPRIRRLCARNDPALVEEATSIALRASNERLRVGVLMLLDGVALPVASVILHWVHDDPYPILDRRALWSVGVDDPTGRDQHSLDLWLAYVAFCRDLAGQLGVSMRVLDRALWQFSYERQPRG